MNFTKKQKLYIFLSILYCCMLLVTNITANRTFEIYGFMLPSAVIAFPIVYIINDVMTECFGLENSKTIILTAFVMNLIAVLFFNVAINLPTTIDFSSYNVVLGSTIIALIASFLAYFLGSFTNAIIMDYMKKKDSKSLMLRCVLSTLVGESIDAYIFISIMFINVLPYSVVLRMIITQALFKTVYEIIVYPITRMVIKYINKL